jgi:hypothetical protein
MNLSKLLLCFFLHKYQLRETETFYGVVKCGDRLFRYDHKAEIFMCNRCGKCKVNVHIKGHNIKLKFTMEEYSKYVGGLRRDAVGQLLETSKTGNW